MSERAFLAPGAQSGAYSAPGPHRASEAREGDPYELSDGHRIECLPAGGRHATANILGGAVLASDPATRGLVGADPGIVFNEDRNLRAPDLAIGVEPGLGWQTKAPPLAVEYAGAGQDLRQLERKIVELLEAGTQLIWVVHLVGPLRVDIHERGALMRTVGADAELVAPGLLDYPVPVRALVEPDAALAAVLRNSLGQHGVRSLDELRALSRAEGKTEGKAEGRAEGKVEGKVEGLLAGLLVLLQHRGLTLTPAQDARVHECRDPATLGRWFERGLRVMNAAEIFVEP